MQYLESLGGAPVLHKQGEGELPVCESHCSEGEHVVTTPHTTHPSPSTPSSFPHVLSFTSLTTLLSRIPNSAALHSSVHHSVTSHTTYYTYLPSLTLPHPPSPSPLTQQLHPSIIPLISSILNSPHLYPRILYLLTSPIHTSLTPHITHHSSSHFTQQSTLPSQHSPFTYAQ